MGAKIRNIFLFIVIYLVRDSLCQQLYLDRNVESHVESGTEYVVLRSKRQVDRDGSGELFSDIQRTETVDIHNTLRRRENAADMEYMTWSSELADIARRATSSCLYQPGHNVIMPVTPQLSQSTGILNTTANQLNMSHVITDWYDSSYDITTGRCSPGMNCDLHLQIIWAASREVGCAYNWCDEAVNIRTNMTSYNVTVLVCTYRPGSSAESGSSPYEVGPSCSKCPSTSKWCDVNLCRRECNATAGEQCVLKADVSSSVTQPTNPSTSSSHVTSSIITSPAHVTSKLANEITRTGHDDTELSSIMSNTNDGTTPGILVANSSSSTNDENTHTTSHNDVAIQATPSIQVTSVSDSETSSPDILTMSDRSTTLVLQVNGTDSYDSTTSDMDTTNISVPVSQPFALEDTTSADVSVTEVSTLLSTTPLSSTVTSTMTPTTSTSSPAVDTTYHPPDSSDMLLYNTTTTQPQHGSTILSSTTLSDTDASNSSATIYLFNTTYVHSTPENITTILITTPQYNTTTVTNNSTNSTDIITTLPYNNSTPVINTTISYNITTPRSNNVTTPPSNNVTTPPNNFTTPLTNNVTTPISNNVTTTPPNNITTPSNNITTPLSNNVTTPISNNVTTPLSNNITTSLSNNVTTPLSNNITTSLSNNVTTPLSNNITTPLSNNVTTSISNNITTPLSNNITPPLSNNVTTTPLNNITTPLPNNITTIPPNNITTTLSNNITTPKPNNTTSYKTLSDIATTAAEFSSTTQDSTRTRSSDISGYTQNLTILPDGTTATNINATTVSQSTTPSLPTTTTITSTITTSTTTATTTPTTTLTTTPTTTSTTTSATTPTTTPSTTPSTPSTTTPTITPTTTPTTTPTSTSTTTSTMTSTTASTTQGTSANMTDSPDVGSSSISKNTTWMLIIIVVAVNSLLLITIVVVLTVVLRRRYYTRKMYDVIRYREAAAREMAPPASKDFHFEFHQGTSSRV